MIIGRDLMVKLDLIADFKNDVLEWDVTLLLMKYKIHNIVQSNLIKRNTKDVLMYTEEPDYTK